MLDDTTIPTWGYKPDGEARIFDLAAGADLPEGWNASPSCITDPALASADALTAAAAGRAYQPPRADPTPPPASAGAAMVEIDRLKGVIEAGMAENQRLFEELDAAEAARDAAIADAATAAAARDRLTSDLDTATADLASLRAALDAAITDKTDLVAKVDAISAELATARTDLDALTAPKSAGKAK
ncbi:hypothetical protein MKK70_21225 [Methylobacterium sp. E-041]|uniref:hypothetical protein n=1 Tax=Methylobacterium sp. E-041 TaxID=2836573 RepID=UPI001FBBCC5C|nr:hypothetical protein [Methylobacterium sp. E-041]MCJ2107852.1 hypothetical protein [Methylobacterium sp. E-041]